MFQVNNKAAELLYSKVGEACDIDEKTIVLDICCGTGTIGLILAKVILIFLSIYLLEVLQRQIC